ncbi:unnamed protein product [Allacma fusca]|uniref:Uncharacterized protein n=1 Tax=Allacma fusca TaxID=39272 RepID=A0A8J2LGD0_9HEXA|nr:unnamed protein product [Allacma fusca]
MNDLRVFPSFIYTSSCPKLSESSARGNLGEPCFRYDVQSFKTGGICTQEYLLVGTYTDHDLLTRTNSTSLYPAHGAKIPPHIRSINPLEGVRMLKTQLTYTNISSMVI